jgi:hypothetical protein
MDYYVLSLLGLSLDIIGVVGLFFLRDRGLRPINQVTVTHPMQGLDIGPGFMTGIDTKINQPINDLNRLISYTNDVNKKILRRSLKWLFLIIVGFVLQFSSTWTQYQEHLHQANGIPNKTPTPLHTSIPPTKLTTK